MQDLSYTTTVIVDGKSYTVYGMLSAVVIDDGIGSYEYWGSKGTDHNYCWDLEDYEIESIDDESGVEVKDKDLLKRIASEYEDKAIAYLSDLPVEDNDE